MAANMTSASIRLVGSVAIMVLCCAPFTVWGQVLSDPTRPPHGIDGAASSSPINDAAAGADLYPKVWGLQSVIISPTHCAAIIDGKIVVLGEKHGSERLMEVSENGVVLQGEHGYRTLALFPAVEMKISDNFALDPRVLKCKTNTNSKVQSSNREEAR